MAITRIISEGWKQYSNQNVLTSFWRRAVGTATSTAFINNGQRRLIQLTSARLVRDIPSTKLFTASMIFHLGGGATYISDSLIVSILPVGAQNETSLNSSPIRIYVRSGKMYLARFAWDNITKNTTGSVHETIEFATIERNTLYHLEIMIDHRDPAACRTVIYLNGGKVLDRSYPAAIGARPCDDAFDRFVIESNTSAGAANVRGEIGDITVYSTTSPETEFPVGVLTYNWQPIESSLSFPPQDTDTPLPVTSSSNIEWQTVDPEGTGPVIGAVAFTHIEASGTVEVVNAHVNFDASGVSLGGFTDAVPPGIVRRIIETDLGRPTIAQARALKVQANRT